MAEKEKEEEKKVEMDEEKEDEKKSLLRQRVLDFLKTFDEPKEEDSYSPDHVWNPEVDDLTSTKQPPKMPKKLPSLIALLTCATPDLYKPAVAHAVFPSLAAHLWKTKFRYVDNVEHEATLMCVLMAGTGAGKSCVNKPIDYIMADIRERDSVSWKLLDEWRKTEVAKGAYQDKAKKPDVVIQELSPDMTPAAFVERMVAAKGRFLYSRMNELDDWDAIEGSGKGPLHGMKWNIMCLSFDPGNRWGQTRVGIDSVSDRVTIRYNWNASTTINKGRRYFEHVATDGPLSRINFCTIPERIPGAEMPVFGTYPDDFAKRLHPYISHLTQVRGLVKCVEAERLIEVLMRECQDEAILMQDRIFENFTFRALVIAYLKACVLYVANGCKWEPEIDDFIRWSLQYDLWCKMEFFYDLVVKEMNGGNRFTMRGPQNLLQQLDIYFTWAQLEDRRMQCGMSPAGTRDMLKKWMKRGFIEQDVVSRSTLFCKTAMALVSKK